MTQPPDAVVILHRAAACQKEDFYPPGMEKYPMGARIKREYLKRMSKVMPPQQGG